MVVALLLVPVLAHLAYAVINSPLTNYYVTVDELAASNASSAPSAQVRVGGPLVPGSIHWDNGTRTMTFQLQGNTRPLTVVYRGFAPDSFRDGATVIVEGQMGASGSFTASTLLVKCPHAYAPSL